MKKVLSFVLVLAMILGSVSMAFAGSLSYTVTKTNTAVPFADAETNVAATVLRDLGALDGDENGKANPDANLTRAEAAALIVKAMGLGDLGAVKTATKFKDVPQDEWYSGWIAVASQQGYMDGVGGNKFDPEGSLSVDEALTLVCKVLGYSMDHVEGTWPTNYRAIAVANGLTKNVTVSSDAAKRADVFEVLYNALDVKFVKWNKVMEQFLSDSTSATIFNLKNKVTGATNSAMVYSTAGAVFGVNTPTFDNGYKPSKDLTGKYVQVLTKDGEEIGVSKVLSTTLEGQFAAGDCTSFKAIDGKYYKVEIATKDALDWDEYQFTNGVTSGAWKVLAKTAGVGGGYALNSATTTKVALEVKLDTTGKKIVAIYSATADVAHKTVKVSEDDVKAITKALANKVNNGTVKLLGETFALTKSGVEYVPNTKLFTVEGDAETLADIQKDDIVTVYLAGGVAGKQVVKLVVTRNTVEGVITKVSALNTSENTYTFNGTAYRVAKTSAGAFMDTSMPGKDEIATKASYILYLNEEGKIAFKQQLTGVVATSQYAFILNAYKNTLATSANGGGAKDAYTVELYKLDGTVVTLTVSTSALNKAEESLFVSNASIVTDWAATAQGQAVEYTVNAAGQIGFLTTVGTLNNYTANDGVQVFNKYIAMVSPAQPYNYTDDVKVIFRDAVNDGDDSTATFYKAGSLSDLVGTTWNNVGYKLDKTGTKVDTIVVNKLDKNLVSVDNTKVFGFVTGYEYDEDAYVVSMLVNGEEKTYKTTAGSVSVNFTTFYVAQLADGMIDTIVAYTTDNAIAAGYDLVFVTPEALTIADNLVVVSPGAVGTASSATPSAIDTSDNFRVMVAEDAVFYTLVPATATVAAHYEVAGSIEDLSLYTVANCFDLNMKTDGSMVNDGVVDVVILVTKK